MDRCAVNPHLDATHSERTVDNAIVPLLRFIGSNDPLNARRRNSIEIDHNLRFFSPRHGRPIQERGARCTSCHDQIGTGNRLFQKDSGLNRLEQCLRHLIHNPLANLGSPNTTTRSNGHTHARAGQKLRHALTNRPCASQHECLPLPRKGTVTAREMPCGHHGSRAGRGVGTCRVKKHADSQRPQKGLPHFFEDGLGGPHIRSTDKDCRRCQIVFPAREHRTVHKSNSRLRGHSAMSQQDIDAGINGNNAIECARLWIAVELKKHARSRHEYLLLRNASLPHANGNPRATKKEPRLQAPGAVLFLVSNFLCARPIALAPSPRNDQN